MEAMRGQEGIQMLLNAEQEAQQIVSNARNMKMQRLKQAKNEADDEIVRYRGHMEDEQQKRISEFTGSSGSNVKRLEEETKAKINDLKGSASKVSPQVISLLLKYVTAVRN